ncbi:DUF3083 family protein [Thalassotalea sp. LPB0316]|uniref:DUF3083 family protein n=1 Tax=Thalassotalea sp. LPB0316 TaxID=2769490 RepID=UPI001865F394|nr:DUF3083 family protein [Thalassotalea sp. LPB0316]QOL26969.1 DUF3083 family protein [Thalassotalea sp. LPB0316]
MSIIRKRSAAHKAFITGNIRDNQYILAEFRLNDDLIEQLVGRLSLNINNNFNELYQHLSQQFFELCHYFEMNNGQFIANDKLVRVRFSEEIHQWQTNQQILFYYNPQYHNLQKAFYEPDKKAQKISLLFLSSGQDIRFNAASFHAKVKQLLTQYCKVIGLPNQVMRLRDHQHLTYDLFAKHKGFEQSQVHKLRTIRNRYLAHHVSLPEDISAMTYAVINIPIGQALLAECEIDHQAADPYNPLYSAINKALSKASLKYNLNNGALIANGLVPIVRYSPSNTVSRQGELQMLGYNPHEKPCGMMSWWDASELVDQCQLIFVASEESRTEVGYGRFLNQINAAVSQMMAELNISPDKDTIMVRFHQHIAYNL